MEEILNLRSIVGWLVLPKTTKMNHPRKKGRPTTWHQNEIHTRGTIGNHHTMTIDIINMHSFVKTIKIRIDFRSSTVIIKDES